MNQTQFLIDSSLSSRAVCDGDDYPMLMSMHLSIVSRLLLSSPRAFSELASAVAMEEGKAHSEVAGERRGRTHTSKGSVPLTYTLPGRKGPQLVVPSGCVIV